MYGIDAMVVVKTANGTFARQVPTFYLNENVQGILSSRHAAKIAESILRAALADKDTDDVGVHVTAVKL